jgi:hypothetical protein
MNAAVKKNAILQKVKADCREAVREIVAKSLGVVVKKGRYGEGIGSMCGRLSV